MNILRFTTLLMTFGFGTLTADVATLSLQRLEGLPDHLEKSSAINQLQRQMAIYNHHEVQIRGFLYRDLDNRLVLASEPNLKSCCVGSMQKIAQQVIVEGEFPEPPSSSKAATLQGTFIVDPQWNANGKLVQIYRLERAIILPDGLPVTSITLAGIGIGSILYILVLFRQNRASKI